MTFHTNHLLHMKCRNLFSLNNNNNNNNNNNTNNNNKYSTVSSASVKDYVLCILVIMYIQIPIKLFFRFFFIILGILRNFLTE